MPILVAGILLAAAPVRAGEEAPEAPAAKPPVINAWVIDIPSTATVAGVTGPVAILNSSEKKYELLKAGRTIVYDDIVRMTPGAVLEVSFRDGTGETIRYEDFPPAAGEGGMWVVFKEHKPAQE